MTSEPPVHNTSFSRTLPGLQIALDSTSLGQFKECPRKYYYSIICSHQPRSESPHLKWGIAIHRVREIYDRIRASGHDHAEALDRALQFALETFWEPSLGRPWLSDIPEKTRSTLVRTCVWYLDHFQDDPIETMILANGKPAVELSFSFDSGFRTRSTGEPIIICGHMDRIGTFGGKHYGCDIKSTRHALDRRFFAQFSPDNQISIYTLAGKIAFGVELEGIIIDGIQVGVNFSRFHRTPVPRNKRQITEFQSDLGWWMMLMETCALRAQDSPDPILAWPMNEKSCGNYGGCPFREVCSKSPEARERHLEADFRKRVWDPLVARGDT